MRLRLLLAAAIVAASSTLPAAAGSPPEKAAKPARQCFLADRINNFASADDRIVNVRVGVKDVYQFEMLGPCPDVEWSQSIAVVSRGSSTICSGLDAEIVVQSSLGPRRCAIRNVRKLTPEEVAALPSKARP